jgi:hypothetical protein
MNDLSISAIRRPTRLTAVAFQGLAAVPPEMEWFANLSNNATRRAYQNALADFMGFTGIAHSEEFRIVTRAHVIAWRDDVSRVIRHDGEAPPLGAGVTVRIPVRQERRIPQSGQGRQAAAARHLRGQNSCAW